MTGRYYREPLTSESVMQPMMGEAPPLPLQQEGLEAALMGGGMMGQEEQVPGRREQEMPAAQEEACSQCEQSPCQCNQDDAKRELIRQAQIAQVTNSMAYQAVATKREIAK